MSGETENLVNATVTTDVLGTDYATTIKSVVPSHTPPEAILTTINSGTNNANECPTLKYELSTTRIALPKGKPCRVILQSTNGPCALIALANSLLLKGTLIFTGNTSVVSNEQLLEALGSTLVNLYYDKKVNPRTSERVEEEGIVDKIANCLQKMQFGMCIDPRFGDAFSFSPFKESLLFELAGVHLCHAMVVEGEEYQELLGDKYNRMRKASYDEAMQLACTDETEEGKWVKDDDVISFSLICDCRDVDEAVPGG